MPTGQLILEITIFGLAVWLGFYLIARNPRAARLRYAGLGVIAYALSLGTDLLAIYAPTESLSLTFARLHWPMLFLPAFFWLASLMNLLDDEAGSSLPSVVKNWQTGLLLTAIPIYLFSAGTNLIFDFSQTPPQSGPAYPIFAAATLLPLLIALGLTWRVYQTAEAKKPIGLIAIATLFFGLSAGLLVFPLG
ncbi:MAG: hypothetical protein R3264_23535, partial [Anaerolineae bacterium]|nr:hypothetical protein [Anaerolineae bacterium]